MTYGGNRQRFYVDGRLLRDRPVPRPGPLLNSRNLTLGGGGAQGLLGSVRISKVARYSTDFTPSKTLKSDAQTVLLYGLSQANDERLRDQSGSGRHGTTHGPRWIVNADPAKAILPKTVTPKSAKK